MIIFINMEEHVRVPGKIKKAMIVISALLIAAHFLRAGSYFLILIAVLSPVLLLIKSSAAVRPETAENNEKNDRNISV